MVSKHTNIAASNSPQERFKQLIEDFITHMLWDFGLRKNEFDFVRNGLRKKAIQKDAIYRYEAKTDFLGHDKKILDAITLLPRATNDIDNPSNFLIDGNTIAGFEK